MMASVTDFISSSLILSWSYSDERR